MIVKLYAYFGVIGILSIIAWATALVLLWISFRRRTRPYYCFLALGAAAAGLILADFNSTIVSAIELDRHDEMAAVVKARQAAGATSDTDATATALRFAEGDPEAPAQEYRKQGKQLRTKSKKTVQTVASSLPVEASEPTVRFLRESDLLAANRLDRINLLLVRLVLWLALLRVAIDYLTRLNSTAGGYCPLPISGRWLDSLFAKKHAVLVQPPVSASMTPQAYAERVVKKGESFIYFGAHDPWPGQDWLPRVAVARWPVWRLAKLDYGEPDVPANGEYTLVTASFNRCGVVAVRDADCFTLLEYIVLLLSNRRDAGAMARKTVHIIMELPQMPMPEDIEPLIQVARETNIKVAIWSHGPVTPELAALFDEQFVTKLA